MAVTWDIDIQVKDVPSRDVTIVGTRTDDSTDPPTVWSKSLEGKLDPAGKIANQGPADYAATLKDLYEREVKSEGDVAAFLGDAKAALVAALSAKEIP